MKQIYFPQKIVTIQWLFSFRRRKIRLPLLILLIWVVGIEKIVLAQVATPNRIAELDYWWTHATQKVFPNTPKPVHQDEELIHISAAKNEYESFQLILHSTKQLEPLTIEVSPFQLILTDTIINFTYTVSVVEFVTITEPSDNSGYPGEWPDPLPPLADQFSLPVDRNLPLWFTFYIPEDAPPGLFRSKISIFSGAARLTIPLTLQVWDFQIPREFSLRSGFGLSHQLIAAYHNIDLNSDEIDTVLHYYFRNMAAHRLCPYNPMLLHPIRIDLTRPPAPDSPPSLRVDFQDFDEAAEKYLDRLGFNAFRLPLEGLGRGSFHSRKPGQIAGFPEGSREYEVLFPSYAQQVVAHLKERGWLDKAYIYWFDEPVETDYEFICQSNQRLRTIAPGLKLFLTEEPHAKLAGCVDIWCLAPQHFDLNQVCRAKERGEEVWWYLCTNPKSPYPTLFIDSPAINLRIWLWMTWKYQFDGILVWQTVYWNSETAFPGHVRQNPWVDPMSYLSGYGIPAGEKRRWGNGDGRFLYPPNRDVNQDKRKFLSGPVNSIRWEMLREGIEDYEYFHLLKKNLERICQINPEHEMIIEMRDLLEIPESIIADLKNYTKDAQLLDQYRQLVAEAIESSQKLIQMND